MGTILDAEMPEQVIWPDQVDCDGTVRIWDPATGEPRAIPEGHQLSVNAVCAVTVDGQDLLASGSIDRTVRIWDPVTGTCVVTLPTYHAALAVTAPRSTSPRSAPT
jgi:WD40 repeat protein